MLPGVERAHIDPAKVRDYLLSAVHPVGRFKALIGPNGREAKFTCVWLVPIDGEAPRFITAFPG